VFGRKDGEANALQGSRDPLVQVEEVRLVEAGEDALGLELVLTVLQQLDEILARQGRGEVLRRHKESQSLLLGQLESPSFTHVFHQPS